MATLNVSKACANVTSKNLKEWLVKQIGDTDAQKLWVAANRDALNLRGFTTTINNALKIEACGMYFLVNGEEIPKAVKDAIDASTAKHNSKGRAPVAHSGAYGTGKNLSGDELSALAAQFAAMEMKTSEPEQKTTGLPKVPNLCRKVKGNWGPIDPRWTRKLPPGGCICARECGGSGDCLFHSIAYAANQELKLNVPGKIDFMTVRDWAALSMESLGVIDEALMDYNSPENTQALWEKQGFFERKLFDIFPGPESKQCRVKLLQHFIRTPGNTFQGDHQTLSWLQLGDNPLNNEAHLGYIVIRKSGMLECTMFINEQTTHVMLLYNLDAYHWQLAGVPQVEGKEVVVKSVFPIDGLPDVIKYMYFQECDSKKKLHERLQPGTALYYNPDTDVASICARMPP